MKVRNTAAGRQGVYTSSGLVYLAPGEELSGVRFTPAQLARARRIKTIKVEDEPAPVPAETPPMVLDNQGDGSVEPADPIDALRKEAEAIGIDVDGRWGEKRLRAEIAKASR